MKLWSGRFSEGTSPQMDAFHSSIGFDARLVEEDIAGSVAHARMLGATGIIETHEALAIIDGLVAILTDVRTGTVEFDVAAEDIHMNIEQLLTARIGSVARKLHTARSRNDQVALDTRLYLMRRAVELDESLTALMTTFLDKAQEHLDSDTVMPGYTHLQRAQPILLAHHLLAYFEMLHRDRLRLSDLIGRTAVMPLGSGALAGTTFPVDREMVRAELGFDSISENSLDAVSDRDYIVEFLAFASILMMHLSRFCEEIVLWASGEFGFIELDDAYSTGSSMMPQKKNPDAAELVRGKTGRVYGNLMSLLTVMKGLPLAYNKDMQEDKEAFFDSIDTVMSCLVIVERMLATTRFKAAKMRDAATGGFTNATDLADYLVRKGVPFRTAHEVVGKAVLECIRSGSALDDMSLAQLRELEPSIEEDVFDAISLQGCLRARRVYGGSGPEAVAQALVRARERLDSTRMKGVVR